MSFQPGPIDYHPGLDDPWLLMAFGLVALVAACLAALVKDSTPWLVITGLAVTAASPFLVAAILHALYLAVDSGTERILCTHWVRRGLLPEISALLGIGAGVILGPRRKHEMHIETGHA